MTKSDLLIRVANILQKLRKMRTHSQFLETEVTEVDKLLTAIEEDLARQIDNYMAMKYDRHNNPREGRRKRDEINAEKTRARSLALGLGPDYLGSTK